MVGGVRFFHYDQAKSTGGRISFSIYVHVSRVSNGASISQEIHVCLPHYFGNCRAHRSPNFRSVAYMVYSYSDFCRHPRQDMFSRLYAWVSKLVSPLKRDQPVYAFYYESKLTSLYQIDPQSSSVQCLTKENSTPPLSFFTCSYTNKELAKCIVS